MSMEMGKHVSTSRRCVSCPCVVWASGTLPAPWRRQQNTEAISCSAGQKSMGEIDFDDKQYQAAVARGNAERLDRPIPVSVRYEAKPGRIVVEFESGASFMVPTSALQGLAKADPHDLAQVELLGETGLHWPSLDIDFTIAG